VTLSEPAREAPPARPETTPSEHIFRPYGTRTLRVSVIRDYGIVAAFVALFITLSLTSSVFLTWTNLLNILDQNAAVGIIAVGSTLVFIAGGFDLSVGAVHAFAGVVAALSVPEVGPGAALLLGLLTGLAFGIVNGVLTTAGRINPFIATLATSIIIGGLAIAITDGEFVSVEDESFTILGRDGLGQLKYTVVAWIVFTVACAVLLHKTRFGRYIYAAGGNAEAARLSGVRVGVIRATTFALSGLSASLAGILTVSQTATAQPDAGGLSLAVLAVTAIVVGGTSILGGEGAVWRTVLGVLLLALIGNGFNLLGVNPTYQDVIRGAIIVAAVGIDAWARRSPT
jgi:ribose transport system permease protein